MDSVGLGFVVLPLVVIFGGAAVVGGIVSRVLKLIEVIRIPDHQYQAAGTEQLTWVLVVVLAGIVGALICQLGKRNDVLAAAGWPPPPPPGGARRRGTGAAPVGRHRLDRPPPPVAIGHPPVQGTPWTSWMCR